MKASEGSAHAKAILMGEHFVLPWTDPEGHSQPGTPALVVPLRELKTTVALTPDATASLNAEAPGFVLDHSSRAAIAQALARAALFFQWDLNTRPLSLRVQSDIPVSRGFGSSAAFSVGLCRAFQDLANREVPAFDSIARELEDVFHGRSSGLDIAGASSDEPVLFSGGSARSCFKIRAADLIAIDSGPRQGSSRMIQTLLEFRASRSREWKGLSARVSAMVGECQEAIARPDGSAVAAGLLSQSHGILRELGLVSDLAQSILEQGLKLGALSGKVSGAGQGGALLLLARVGEGQALARALRAQGVGVLAVIHAEGTNP